MRALNQYIRTPHFKMESIASVKDVIRVGDFMGRLDLKDAYLSVPVAKKHRKFLRFRWKGKNYEFETRTAIWTGISSKNFHQNPEISSGGNAFEGKKMIKYLDDTLIMAQTETTLREYAAEVAETLSRLGFIINAKKSISVANGVPGFLGGLTENGLTASAGESGESKEDT